MKKKEICALYYDFVVEQKKRPKKLKKFLSHIDLPREDFLAKYSNLCEVEADVWKRSLKKIIKVLKSSEDFARYSSRDRGLAFMYSWFECMSENRHFFQVSKYIKPDCYSPRNECKGFQKEVKKFICELIDQGLKRSEFKNRGLEAKMMSQFFWSLFHVNLKSWQQRSKKSSQKNEVWMDAMIEKSMIFFFDSLAPNIFDTFVDMLKHRKSK